jgi:hypothetical protein
MAGSFCSQTSIYYLGRDPALSDHGRVLGPTAPSLGRDPTGLGRGKGRLNDKEVPNNSVGVVRRVRA